MKNPIEKCGLFATPESMEVLQEYCERFSGGERTAAVTVLGMTWNLASETVENSIKGETTDTDEEETG